MQDEVPVSLFRFKRWETAIGLVIGVFLSPLVILSLKRTFYEVPCQATFFSTDHQIWFPTLLMMPLIFWAAIGVTRFVRNEQRHIGSSGHVVRVGHLSFLIPAMFLLLFVDGAVGAALAGAAIVFLLITIIYKTLDQSLVMHLVMLLGQLVIGVIFLVVFLAASLGMMMFDFMWCLL